MRDSEPRSQYCHANSKLSLVSIFAFEDGLLKQKALASGGPSNLETANCETPLAGERDYST